MAECNVMETWRGRHLDLLDPDGADICIEDIAWALSRQARFNGHTHGRFAYTVAQHSLWCAWAAQHWFQASPELALHALLHDATEAYMGDIVSPLKAALGVAMIEQRLQAAIYTGLGIEAMRGEQAGIVAECDRIALAVEAYHLLASNGKGWACARDLPVGARQHFWVPMQGTAVYQVFVVAWETLRKGLTLPDRLEEVAAL